MDQTFRSESTQAVSFNVCVLYGKLTIIFYRYHANDALLKWMHSYTFRNKNILKYYLIAI